MAAARRYTLRLYQFGRLKGEKTLAIAPSRDSVLRRTLEDWVDEIKGSGKFDLSEWGMVVHSLGGGMVHARIAVNSDGVATVKR